MTHACDARKAISNFRANKAHCVTHTHIKLKYTHQYYIEWIIFATQFPIHLFCCKQQTNSLAEQCVIANNIQPAFHIWYICMTWDSSIVCTIYCGFRFARNALTWAKARENGKKWLWTRASQIKKKIEFSMKKTQQGPFTVHILSHAYSQEMPLLPTLFLLYAHVVHEKHRENARNISGSCYF